MPKWSVNCLKHQRRRVLGQLVEIINWKKKKQVTVAIRLLECNEIKALHGLMKMVQNGSLFCSFELVKAFSREPMFQAQIRGVALASF